MSEDMTHYEGDGCDAPDAHGRHREAAEYLEQHKPTGEAGRGERARRPEDRGADYLRSVVEQIHRDAHDALSAVPVQPPPRDPAGEGEVAWWSCVLCGFSAAILCRGCRSARHMPAPRGATCSERHHEYQTPARPSSPTGETPESYCDRCNYDRHICPGCGDGLPHGVEVCGHCQPTGETPTRDYSLEPADECQECIYPEDDVMHTPPNGHEFVPVQPTGETAGQGVEGGAAARLYAQSFVHLWSNYLDAKADRERAEARATAAEAERDRLREALQERDSALKSIVDTFYSDSRPMGHVARSMMALANAALAGESTGAGEGE